MNIFEAIQLYFTSLHMIVKALGIHFSIAFKQIVTVLAILILVLPLQSHPVICSVPVLPSGSWRNGILS